MEKLSKEDLQNNLKINLGNDPYSPMVSIAALYKKLYGEFPKIGLSGQQAEFVDELVDVLPEPK